MCSGIETDCFFFFIRGLGWPTFFTLLQSEVSDELLFLLYLNQRPRMSYFFLLYLNQRPRMSILFLFLLYPRARTNVFSLNRKIAPRRITIAGQSELTANITKFTKRCCVYHPGLLGSSFGFFSISSAGMGQR